MLVGWGQTYILLIFFFMILAKGCDILTGWWLSWWYVCLQYFIANFFHITNKFFALLFFNTGVLLLR